MTDLAFPSGLPSGQGFVRLRELRDCLQPREVMHWRDLAVDGLAFHSAEVRAGNLFFAIRGTKNDGTVFAQQAIARGAVAVVAEVDGDGLTRRDPRPVSKHADARAKSAHGRSIGAMAMVTHVDKRQRNKVANCDSSKEVQRQGQMQEET